MTSEAINTVGWLLFSVMNDGTTSSAQFPTEPLCNEGKSIVMTGRSIEEEKAYQESLIKAEEDRRRADEQRIAKAVAAHCGGSVPCNIPNGTRITVREDYGTTCNYIWPDVRAGMCISGVLMTSIPIDGGGSKTAKSAQCFPIPAP